MEQDTQSYSRFQWWEKKRIIFNLAVGITGLVTTLFYSKFFNLFDFCGTLMWGIVANFAYTIGFILEMVDCYYFREKLNINRHRLALFILGTLTYCILSYEFARTYYEIS